MAAAAGDFVGPRLAPAGLGFITLFFGIGQALGPALGGYLADVSGSFTLPFEVAGGISLVGMVLSFYLKETNAQNKSYSNNESKVLRWSPMPICPLIPLADYMALNYEDEDDDEYDDEHDMEALMLPNFVLVLVLLLVLDIYSYLFQD